MAKCKAKTANGKQCKNEAIDGKDYCHIKAHREQIEMSQKDTNNSSDKGLTEIQINVIDMLIAGVLTKTEIADRCDIARKTIYRWLEDEAFIKEYRNRLQEIRDKFNPILTQKINDTLSSMNPLRIDDEKDRANYLEKLVKIQQLLEGKATDIVNNQLTGKDGQSIKVEDMSNLSIDQLRKIAYGNTGES